MRRSEFDYELPEALIAQRPLAERSASRLLQVDGATGQVCDRRFVDLAGLLEEGDLLVFNNTRVIPARLPGRKASGGRIEVLIERASGDRHALAQVKASKSPRPGAMLEFDVGRAQVLGRAGDLYRLRFDRPVQAVLDACGHVPLPPYIRRPDDATDRARYQTVYARSAGAVAAPTAGLHFSEAVLSQLAAAGIESCEITLHVGAGTFQPMRAQELEDHRMHSERLVVSKDVCEAIAATHARGRRVIAVGTTSMRALESAARQPGGLAPMRGETDLFLYPGARFRVVDVLVTNFHLPQSTLLMLVCAFAGYDTVMEAYRHAVRESYRFFSYGDAMFVSADPAVREGPQR